MKGAKMTDTELVTRKFVAVRRDITEYVSSDWMTKHGVAKVYDVLVYDPERRVHCCSLTASWELVPVYHTYDSARDLSDDEREEIEQEMMRWDLNIEYWDNDPSTVGATRDLGEWTCDDADECESGAIERERCNPSF
jgi:hypothetical protein